MRIETVRAGVPAVVDTLGDRLHAVLGDRLVAIYLGGSYATGDFVDGSSDFDVLVILRDELTPADLSALSTLHATLLRERPDASRLEGDYVPRAWLVPRGTTRPAPFFRAGRLEEHAEYMLSADNIADMREHGVTVFGAAPADVLPEVTPEQVRAAVRAMLADEPASATERAAADEILDLARSLAALDTGHPTSKTAGVRWALDHLDAKWHPFVLRADDVRHGRAVDEGDATLRRALTEMRASLLA
jgi:hypothetical protein